MAYLIGVGVLAAIPENRYRVKRVMTCIHETVSEI